MYMLYRLLRSDPKIHSGNPSELVIRVEPELLQSKMELLATNLPIHIQHFFEPCSIEPVSFFSMRGMIRIFLYRANFCAHHDINFMFVML